MDEIDGSFFDHIDDLLDFPTEDVDSILPLGKPETVLPNIWAESYPCSDSVFSGSGSDLSAELSVPYEDIVQLEWLSTFVEDSFSGGSLAMTTVAEPEPVPKNHRLFHTLSPVSVLDSNSSSSSSSSCSAEKRALHSPDAVVLGGKYGRARSKRPRPATFSPRRTMVQLVPPPPLLHCSISDDENPSLVPLKFQHEPSENFAESSPTMVKAPDDATLAEPKKKNKKIKLTLPPRPSLADAEDEDVGSTLAPVRKCLHCEITKTPQWRAGPLGPKTLCNACGVRYKSGRLFPEYRPAASPTFTPSLHSNSHKKVLEMRGITVEKPATNGRAAAVKDAQDSIPNPDLARRNGYM